MSPEQEGILIEERQRDDKGGKETTREARKNLPLPK
jgi:hypothetical protein